MNTEPQTLPRPGTEDGIPAAILARRATLGPIVSRAADALDAVIDRAEQLQRDLLANAYTGGSSPAAAAGLSVAAWQAMAELADQRIQEHSTLCRESMNNG